MIYPQKLNSKKSNMIVKIAIMVSLLVAGILLLINTIATPKIHWAGLCNAGILYIWVTVLYSINKNINIGGHVLIQTVAISLLTMYIDYKTGFKAWSIDLAIPIILIIANLTMLILTIISHRKYIKYVIYQLILFALSMLPFLFVYENLVQNKTLSYVASGISIINFGLCLILYKKDIKEELIRKFHI